MKIKQIKLDYDQVVKLPKPKALKPLAPSFLLSTVVRVLAGIELAKTKFTYTAENLEVLKKGPCLILMNHSSFLDLKIASKILYPKKYNIISTSDGLVGKKLLMRLLGCVPTKKFVSDISLIRDMKSIFAKGRHVLMYPEAGYSFDGCATPLPKKFGVLLKSLKIPVVTIITKGAFAYDPLYNGLQIRKVQTSAHAKCLFTKEEIESLSVEELSKGVEKEFNFDNFAWQQQNKIKIAEPFRADGLDRILYKCPHCGSEGTTLGLGVNLTCSACKKSYFLNEYGYMVAEDGNTEFPHIPDWFNWQRQEVKKQILNGTYLLDTEVEIGMLVDYKALYRIGSGRLIHNENGFVLTGANGKLNYQQSTIASYTLNADYYWYEIDDVICIGDTNALYYCFPKTKGVVSKTRLAVEELYKIKKGEKI